MHIIHCLIFFILMLVFSEPMSGFQRTLCEGDMQSIAFFESADHLEVRYFSTSDSVKLYGYGIHYMQEIEEDCWNANLELADSDQARISFYIQEFYDGKATFIQQPVNFIGSSLPENEQVVELSGKIDSVLIESEYLTAERWVFFYKPPDYIKKHEYPVLYMTDGSSSFLRHLSGFVEHLIVSDQIPPILLIATAANRYTGTVGEPYNPALNLRNLEYVEGFATANNLVQVDTSLFRKHKDFFLLEVGYWAEQNLNASPKREHRLLQGSSSGGAFATHIGLSYPEEFAHVLVYSTAYNEKVMNGSQLSMELDYPFFHLVSGEFEGGFNFQTVMLESRLKEMNGKYYRVLGKSGHDPLMWREELIETLKRIYD